MVARAPPSNPAELEEYLLAQAGLSRALHGRVTPNFSRSNAATYVSSSKADFNDPATRGEAVEAADTTHFHRHDAVSAHGAW